MRISKKNIREQILDLYKIADRHQVRLHHVKAHGALYNDLMKSSHLSTLFLEVIISLELDLKIIAMPDSALYKICTSLNVDCIPEVFADRSYQNAHTLRSRKLKNAILSSVPEITDRISFLKNGKLKLYSGEFVDIQAETICVHSDSVEAVEIVKIIRQQI